MKGYGPTPPWPTIQEAYLRPRVRGMTISCVPDEEIEAMRDLTRAREDAKLALEVGKTQTLEVPPAPRPTLPRQDGLDEHALGLDPQADLCP